MYAIIKTGGKQYRVSEGDVLNIEKLDVEAGSEVVFDEVLTVVAKVIVNRSLKLKSLKSKLNSNDYSRFI